MATMNLSLFDVPLPPPSSIHFSSKSVEWATPQDFFDKLDAEFHFETDVCSTHENAKCENHYTVEENGLSRKWTGVCWMNPPYVRNVMAKWIEKAHSSSLSQVLRLCVLFRPERTQRFGIDTFGIILSTNREKVCRLDT